MADGEGEVKVGYGQKAGGERILFEAQAFGSTGTEQRGFTVPRSAQRPWQPPGAPGRHLGEMVLARGGAGLIMRG